MGIGDTIKSAVATDKDYRFVLAVALLLLMAFVFGIVLYKDGTVQDAIEAGISPFIGLVAIIINNYFVSKES